MNGNLTSDGATSFAYDAENRLVSASGAKNATLSYDPMGRLFQISAATGTTQFLYDDDELVAEYNGISGSLLRRYVHGPAADDPLLWYEGAGLATRHGLFANHQGTIVAVADANGNSVGINAYDAYGVPNPGNMGRFQYTGQAWLTELGLYHYKARLYSPTLGRFLQTDPIGYDDDVNLYQYALNDPLNNTDPTGEWVWHAVGAAISMTAYAMTTDKVTAGGLMVAAASGAFGGGAIKAVAQLGKTGFTLMAGSARLTTTVAGMPTSVSLGQVAGAVGQTAGAMAAGAGVGAATQVATNIADAAGTGELGNMTHPLAGVDSAAAAGALAGPIEGFGGDAATGATAAGARVGGKMGQLADGIDAAKGAAAKSGASTGVQTGAGALQNDQCAQKGQCR